MNNQNVIVAVVAVVALAKKGGEVFGNPVVPAALLLHAGVAGAAAEAFLDRLDGGGEGDVANIWGHEGFSLAPESTGAGPTAGQWLGRRGE